MLLTATSRACCRHYGQTRQLVGLGRARNTPVLFSGYIAVRRIHGENKSASHHDATENIRNIGIIAHVDAGKTTTTERMLYYSGRTRFLGNVDSGNTTTDFLELERKRGITIQSAAITLHWPPKDALPDGQAPKTINLIDTPGHQDFRYEVDRCLPILDGAVCILDSVKGVETHTERVWNSAHLSKIPRLVFVNKLDREGASFKRSVQEVAARLKTLPLLCQIPWWNGDNFIGVIDVINQVGIRFSSTGAMNIASAENIAKENPALRAEMQTARQKLVESLVEYDEQIQDEFLSDEQAQIPASSIKKAIRRLIMDGEGRFAPVFAGASFRNIGVQPLLDGVIDYLPSPLDRPELQVTVASKTASLTHFLEEEAKTKRKNRHPGQPPILALAEVFKVVDDPKRGMMSYVRVYHGSLSRSSHMWNSHVHTFEKPLNLLHVFANDHHEIQEMPTGHIGAMTGLKSARTGDTLLTFPGHQSHGVPEPLRNLQIKTLDIPPAVAFMAIDPYTPTFREKLREALSKLSREDPSIRWSVDEKTETFILSGMGLLHLEIAQHRLLTHYKIDKESAMWGDIQVEYAECPLDSAGPLRAVFERPLRDKPGRAACTVSIEPLQQHHHDQVHSTSDISESFFQRDGNIVRVCLSLPENANYQKLPYEPETIRQQLLNGAIAGLARGPRRSSRVRNCYVSITWDPEDDYFGVSSTGGHITNSALGGVRGLLKEIQSRGQMGLLEPFTNFTITCPEESSNVVQHDLTSARGGQVLEIRKPEEELYAEGGIDVSNIYIPPDPYESVQSLRDPRKNTVRMLGIVGKAPLKEMMKYDSQLRSMTGGRHELTLSPGDFELVVGPREKALDNLG
ncbi:P-loop containing nucleoside triphosphate hydrolase protein [Rhypophila decipiens]|uniref:P-loop containing nucleoside triphosphate hydrolase protein n=1 Tax=Rhypophila decipiens TaxID=261697 RepID=A0AAN6Y848_9PEZI|nr:P-loop containing nucleoside triphosphate hydrolase protein [Rhypophila decipiens]